MSFFSEAKFEYIDKNQEIPAKTFLLTCNEIIPFMDIIGPISFKIPKADINGHIQRVMKKHCSDPQKFYTLQNIVDSEIKEACSKNRSSCTSSILWLNRTLEFVCGFLEAVFKGETDMVACCQLAYEHSLKPYHNWALRSIFHLLVRMVPNRDKMVASLKKDPSLSDEELMEHMRLAMETMRTNTTEINRFFTIRGQNRKERSNPLQFTP